MVCRLLSILLLAQTCYAAGLRWAVISDIHTGYPGFTSGEPDVDYWYIQTNFSPSFVILVGDTANVGTEAQFTTATNKLAIFTCPVHAVPGNHDYDVSTNTYFNALGNPNWSFTNSDYKFIGFECLLYSSSQAQLSQATLEWLAPQITNRDGTIKLLFTHNPVDSTYSPSEIVWNLGGQQLTNWMSIGQVPLFAYGHLHRCNLSNNIVANTLATAVTHGGFNYTMDDCSPGGLFQIYNLTNGVLTIDQYKATPPDFPLHFTFTVNIGEPAAEPPDPPDPSTNPVTRMVIRGKFDFQGRIRFR